MTREINWERALARSAGLTIGISLASLSPAFAEAYKRKVEAEQLEQLEKRDRWLIKALDEQLRTMGWKAVPLEES